MMGNICSKSSHSRDAFAGPGRVLGTVPPPVQSPRVTLPQKTDPSRSNTGTGRTLGGSEGNSDARNAAGRAAEVRKFGSVALEFPPSISKQKQPFIKTNPFTEKMIGESRETCNRVE